MEIVTIDKVVYNGYGLGKLNGKIIFVDNVLPAEEIVVDIYKDKKNFSYGKLVEIRKPSPYRVLPECPLFNNCGGCQWQHIEYDFQVILKRDILLENLKRIGKLKDIPDIEIIKSKEYHYRNRARFHVKNGKIGFYKKLSNEFVEINHCKILNDNINDFIKGLKLNNSIKKLDIFSSNSGEILSTLNKDYVYNKIGSWKYRISKNSFFQSNEFLIEKLINIVLEHCKGYEKFADLFSGVGLFTIPLSEKFCNGVSIEFSKSSFYDCLENLKINKINNVKVFKKRVEKSGEILKLFQPDIVVVDPPRGGIKKDSCEILKSIENIKKIIYVSCNPITLSRDLQLLSSKFHLQKLFLIDMFPQTFHLETLAILIKK